MVLVFQWKKSIFKPLALVFCSTETELLRRNGNYITNTQANYATSCICLQVLLALNMALRKHSLEKIKNVILPQEICSISGLIILCSIATWI